MELMKKPQFAWLNGEIVAWENCVLHARSQGAFWGANVFEGIRAYWNSNDKQLYIYRMNDHLQRLKDSMKCIDMPIRFSDENIQQACIELLKANSYQEDIHIVIVAYFGFGQNFDSLGYTEDTGMHITALPMPRSIRYSIGAHATVSSWRRISDDSMPPRIKTGANYHNSRLAQHEAQRNGYDTAIFLNHRGTIAEAPGSCIAMVDKNVITTPPGYSGVMDGITIASIQELSHKLGLRFERREIDRTELYLADEVILCGTLVEIQPVISLDRKLISDAKPGKSRVIFNNSMKMRLGCIQLATFLYQYTSFNFIMDNIMMDDKSTLFDLLASTSQNQRKIYDLTAPLSESTPVIKLPSNKKQAWGFTREIISHYDEEGQEAFWHNFSMSEHTGTHFDAPIHWLSGKKDGIDVSQIPLNDLIAPAVVIDMSHKAQSSDFLLEREHVEQWCQQYGPLPENGWLLFRSGWDAKDIDAATFLNDGHSPGISVECAKWLAEETSIRGVGVETVGTDAGQAANFDPPFPVHWYFLGAGKYGITQLKNLVLLPPTGVLVIIAPLPIVGGSGSPCRVYAVVDNKN